MDIKDYLQPLQKWWWLILASTLIATVTSYIGVSQQDPIYEVKTTLIIGRAIENPNPSGVEFFLSQQLAATYASIAQRTSVRDAAKENLGLNWLPYYVARRIPNTQLLEISVTDTSPERAQAVANEIAQQVILNSPTATSLDDPEHQEFIEGQLDDLLVAIQDTQAEIQKLQDELNVLISAREIATTQTQINSLQNKLNTLQSNYAALLANTQQGAMNSIQVFDEAVLPTEPVGPNTEFTVIAAAAIGFILAAGAAYILEYLDDTIKNPDDIQNAIDLPTLVSIGREKNSDPLITMTQPRSPISETFRALRTGIRFANIDNPYQILQVTSTNPSEGKSFTSSNLGVVMAQAGYRVLIIDGDLRRPVQHTIFDIPNRDKGLTTILLDFDFNKKDVVQDILNYSVHQKEDLDGLHIITSGPIPHNPSELLSSSKMGAFLELMKREFDYVILDTPPVSAVTDSVVLGTRSDAIVLVIDAGRTKRNHLKLTKERLDQVNANVIGTVLNRMGTQGGDYYYYNYNYKYDHAY
ncbi:MAG TPA: polysaccharide biosynthesis tyrosine autokinase [Anaerolineae bacterium]|nr:polysaccharide biosynthesis tyrosine autokinase [Anaerolineae bacterium]